MKEQWQIDAILFHFHVSLHIVSDGVHYVVAQHEKQ